MVREETTMGKHYRETMEIIKGRRSIRRFSRQPVEPDKIERLLEAARWAPSSGNRQPWQFVVITRAQTIATLKMILPGVMGNMTAGPVLLGICLDTLRRSEWSEIDLGCALQNLLLCAHSLGLGACAIGGFDRALVRELLQLPDESDLCMLVTLGYPSALASAPPRRELADLLIKVID